MNDGGIEKEEKKEISNSGISYCCSVGEELAKYIKQL